eukprot:TRINITY_DN4676_c0_g1_i1.p1 TRINITY_DN4676_c0_g1~~TRINITY_DN4676_c0_g1_i1.p1  ORF type:complete len:795 (-),score=146.79 TRINITY_DN4676_c0_g1_i1:1329-3713(-)
MSQSEYQYNTDKSEVSSTISAKTVCQKGYAKKSKAQLDKIEEEQLAQKWAEENRRLKQLSKESKRRLAAVKKKEAEQRLKVMKEQTEALERKKRLKEQYYVHNIRNQIKQAPKKAQPRPSTYKPVAAQKPIACQRANNRAITATNKPAPKRPAPEIEKEPEVINQVNEVRLEDFLQPSSNLNGLDLDVRGSMQLSMKKLGIKEDSLMKKCDLLDSLDLQIAAIIGNGNEEKMPDSNDSLEKPGKMPEEIIKGNILDDKEEEIKEEIVGQEENKEEWLKKSIKTNVDNWKKVNNQVRKEMPLKKINEAASAANMPQVRMIQANSMVALGKEDIRTDKILVKDVKEDSLVDSLTPNLPQAKVAPARPAEPKKIIENNKENMVVNQSTEMAALFGSKPSEADQMRVSTFGWVKGNAELLEDVKSIEEKEVTFGKGKANALREEIKPVIAPKVEPAEPIRTAIEKAIHNKHVVGETKEPIKPTHNVEPTERKNVFDQKVPTSTNPIKPAVKKNKPVEAVPKPPRKPMPLKEENLSEMAPRAAKLKGGPKSRATTVFTHDEDFNVEEFIIVFLCSCNLTYAQNDLRNINNEERKIQEEIIGLHMDNYWKQRDVYQKYQIDNQVQSSKEVLSKLTGLPLADTNKPVEPEEDALLESINNLDYLLVQQKMPEKEKQEARLKLAGHMGAFPQEPEKKLVAKKPKGIRAKIDEIKSQRSEILEPPAKPVRKPRKEVKYAEVNKRVGSKEREVQSEQYGFREDAEEVQEIMREKPKEPIKEKVIVNEKFNIKDILVQYECNTTH